MFSSPLAAAYRRKAPAGQHHRERRTRRRLHQESIRPRQNGSRHPGPRALRTRRRREGRLPQWVSDRQGEDGGGRVGIFGAAGSRHAGAIRLERAVGAFGAHAGTRASGGRALCPWPVDPRHRGRVHRRDGPEASVAGGGERSDRTAVGRVRGLLQARSFRARHRLSVRRRHRRAASTGSATRGGAGRLGRRRGRTQGPAWVDGGLQGGRRGGAGVLSGPARP